MPEPTLATTPQPNPERHGLPARLRVVLGIASGFIGVIAVAAVLLGWAIYARSRGLSEHYARAGAQLAQQVEARLLLERQRADTQVPTKGAKLSDGLAVSPNCASPAGAAGSVLSDDGSAIYFPPAKPDLECTRLEITHLLGSEPLERDEAVERYSRRFEHVLLVAAQGAKRGAVLAARARTGDALRAAQLPELVDDKTPGNPHMRESVVVGVHRYRAFIQPVSEPAWAACGVPPCASVTERERGGDQRVHLVVVGLVDEDELTNDARRIRPQFFVWALLVCGLGVLLLPTAKLWLSGPYTRLGRADIAFLVVAAVLTMFLATTLFLGFVARERLMARSEASQRWLSAQIEHQLVTRLDHAAKLLDKIASGPFTTAGTAAFPGGQSESGDRVAVPLACGADMPTEIASRVQRETSTDKQTSCFNVKADIKTDGERALWQRVFWADTSGKQRVKYAHDEKVTPLVDLAERPYFTQALREQCLPITRAAAASGCGPGRAVPYVVPSVTTSERVLMVALPTYGAHDAHHSRHSPDERRRVTGVMVLESTIPDLANLQYVPLGFQMAVVDGQGRVMLHSDNENHQGFNILDDVDDPLELKASLAARRQRVFDIAYLGEANRVYVHPLAMGWQVLVFAPSNTHDVATMHIVLLVGSAFLLFSGVCVASIVLAWLLKRLRQQMDGENPKPVGAFWPNASRGAAYGQSIRWALGVGLGVWILAALCTLLIPEAFAFCFVLLVLVGFRTLRLARTATEPRRLAAWERHLPFAYTNCAFALMTTLVIAPTSLLFLAAYDQVAEELVRTEQNHAMRVGLSASHIATARTRGTIPLVLECARHQPDSCCRTTQSKVCDAPTPVASAQLPRLRCSPPSMWSRPFAFLQDILPLLAPAGSPDSSLLYQVGRSCGHTERDPGFGWSWQRRGFDLTVFQGHEQLRTHLPSLLSNQYSWWRMGVWVACFAFFVACACVTSYRSLRRLFFLDSLTVSPGARPPDAPEFELAWSACSPDQRYLLAQIAYYGHASPHPRNRSALEKLARPLSGQGDAHLVLPETFTLSEEVSTRVKERMSVVELNSAEDDSENSTWTYLRGPMGAAVTILLLSLGVSQASVAAIGLSVPPFLTLLVTLIRTMTGQESK